MLALVMILTGVARPVCAQALRVNHLQAKGTHNSYHLAPPGAPPYLDYSHAPLREQLEAQGVRQLELDVHWSDGDGQFRVWHEPGDERSTCATLIGCLLELRDWSDEHPWHHLLMVAVELKGDDAAVDEGLLERLDGELDAVWPASRRLSPDELLGDAPSLVDAVATRGWPSLDETRGEALFVLWNTGRKRALYSRDGASLAGRAMFVRGAYGSPVAVVLGVDNPLGREGLIQTALARGFLVRVRADRAVWEPLFNWTLRRDLALSLGATWVATDFPAPESGAARGLDYHVFIPDGEPSRCNPITAPAWCRPDLVEPSATAGIGLSREPSPR
jgi:hypothetical protein